MKDRLLRLIKSNNFMTIFFIISLRVALMITIRISFFNRGFLFDIAAVVFVISLITFFIKNRIIQKILYFLLSLIFLIITIIDIVYYSYFETLISKNSIKGIQWLTGNKIEYGLNIPIIGYIVIIIILLYFYRLFTNKNKNIISKKSMSYISLVFLIPLLSLLMTKNESYKTELEYFKSDKYLYETVFDRVTFTKKFGYYIYHTIDTFREVEEIDVDSDLKIIDDFFEKREEKAFNEMTGKFAGRNVITITAESLETRFIDEVLTPNLYKLKTEGMTFSNYFTPVFQQGATCNSEFMSLVGIGAHTSSDWSNNLCDSFSENKFSYSMPNQLLDKGYNTYYFHSGDSWFYNRSVIIPNYGFEVVKFKEDLLNKDIDFNFHYDSEMIYFIDEYVNLSKPFFMNLLNYSMHGSYDQDYFEMHNDRVDDAYKDILLPDEVRIYMQKLIEFDNLIGELLNKLEEENVLDNTLFVIYPDHHPYMMSSNIYYDYIGVEEGDIEVHRQELIIYDGGSVIGEVYDNPGSTIDIVPTVLNLLGNGFNYDYFFGKDIFDPTKNYIYMQNNTLTDGTNYLELNGDYFGDELYLDNLERALETKMIEIDIQKRIFNIDYFKLKGE